MMEQNKEPYFNNERGPHREIIQEITYPEFWTPELVNKWVKDIPQFVEFSVPETPILEFDLSDEGLGKILIKDESRLEINPTGIMKDRMARISANIYRGQAEAHLAYPDFPC